MHQVKFTKRPKGGYYAFVTMVEGGRERCAIVQSSDGTGKVGAAHHWTAKAHGKAVTMETRKHAVEALARRLGW